jgi:hypothetical protein
VHRRLIALVTAATLILFILAGASSALAAPVTFTDPSVVLPTGHSFYPSATGRDITAIVGQGYVLETFTYDVSRFTSADTFDITVEYTADNWQTVILGGEYVTTGGVVSTRKGPTASRVMIADLPFIPNGTVRERLEVTASTGGDIGPVALKLS